MAQNPPVKLDTHSVRRSGGVGRGALFYGLIAPPLVWAIQLYLNFALASHVCFPSEEPRTSFLPGWERIWTTLLVVNLACAVIGALGLLASGYSWRRLRNEPTFPTERGGGFHASNERMRSFATSGLMVSGLFTAAILLNTLYLWALSSCSQV